MNCTHEAPTRAVWMDVEVSPWGDMEAQWVAVPGESYCVDLDTGRYQCTRCKKVMYYTGLWRDFYEKGIPCSGSDSVSRAPTLENTK